MEWETEFELGATSSYSISSSVKWEQQLHLLDFPREISKEKAFYRLKHALCFIIHFIWSDAFFSQGFSFKQDARGGRREDKVSARFATYIL